MKILKLFRILASFYALSAVQAMDDFNMPKEIPTFKLHSNEARPEILSLSKRIETLEEEGKKQADFINQQKIIIHDLTKDIENLKRTTAMLHNPQIGYHKRIPADAGVWVALAWSLLTVAGKFNEGYFNMLTVGLTTFFTIYWVFKETRNLAVVVKKEH